MAMNGDPPQAPRARPAPVWIAGAYGLGLVLVFLGQRVLASYDSVSAFLSVLGVLAVILSTLLRYSPRFRVGGERRHIEQLLGGFSLVGLAGIAVYFASTDWFAARLGLFALEETTLERVQGVLYLGWVVLLALAVVPLVFAETAAWPMRLALLPESRRVRAAASAGFVLVLAAIYGSLLVYVAKGWDWKTDYSYFKTSRPSDSTRKIAESLNEPVMVRGFFPDVNEVRSEVERYLRDLAKTAPNLQVELKDRLLVPKLAKELRVNQDGTIVLSQGQASEQLRVGTDLKDAGSKLRVLDRDFQEKLVKLARSRRTAYLTQGHGELTESSRGKEPDHSSRIVRTLLQRQNYTVKDLASLQGLGKDVPDDADLVLVLSPTEPFAREEIASLERYAKRGGKLFVALDPDAETTSQAILPEEVGGAQEQTPPVADAGTPKSPSAAPKAPGADAGAPGDAGPGDAGPGIVGQPPTTDRPTLDRERAGQELRLTTSHLEALANVLGLRFSTDLVEHEEAHALLRHNPSDRALVATNQFSSHASVSTLNRDGRKSGVFLFGVGSLESQPGSANQVDFAIRSMPNSYADTNRNYRFDPGEVRKTWNLAAAITGPALPETKGPDDSVAESESALDGGVESLLGSPDPSKPDGGAAKKPKASAKGGPTVPKEMRAFVLADGAAVSDFVLSGWPPNQLMFVDAVRWMVGEESFAGEETSEEDLRIEHTKQQDLVWFYLSIFGAPALVLGASIALRGRPRRRQGGKQS